MAFCYTCLHPLNVKHINFPWWTTQYQSLHTEVTALTELTDTNSHLLKLETLVVGCGEIIKQLTTCHVATQLWYIPTPHLPRQGTADTSVF